MLEILNPDGRRVEAGFIDALEINDVTLFAQDWGGLIGLRVVEQRPEKFARIMISNTTLPAMGGAQGQAHTIVKDGAHFIQEDKPEELVSILDAFIKAN